MKTEQIIAEEAAKISGITIAPDVLANANVELEQTLSKHAQTAIRRAIATRLNSSLPAGPKRKRRGHSASQEGPQGEESSLSQ